MFGILVPVAVLIDWDGMGLDKSGNLWGLIDWFVPSFNVHEYKRRNADIIHTYTYLQRRIEKLTPTPPLRGLYVTRSTGTK